MYEPYELARPYSVQKSSAVRHFCAHRMYDIKPLTVPLRIFGRRSRGGVSFIIARPVSGRNRSPRPAEVLEQRTPLGEIDPQAQRRRSLRQQDGRDAEAEGIVPGLVVKGTHP